MDAATAPFRAARAAATDAQATADDVLLERLRREARLQGPVAAAESFMYAVAGQAPPTAIAALVERLRNRSRAHQHAQADALLADGRQLPDAALTLRELSAPRYGVYPLVSACYARALYRQYPADPPEPARGRRERRANPAGATTATGATTASACGTSAIRGATNTGDAPAGDGSVTWDGTPQPTPTYG